jgi:hypothetical protein
MSTGSAFAGIAELVGFEEAAEEGGAWVSGADSEFFSSELFSGVGSVF